MFSHILLPLDGSEYGERVLAYAADLAAASSAQVTLLTVIQSDGPTSDEDEAARCGAYLDGHAETLRGEGIENVAVQVRAGVLPGAIAEAARELGVDLIAMSTQGLSAESDEGLGSVASAVLVSAPCPVFMVRIRRPDPPKGVAEERWQSEGGANVG